jgi:sugar O-acyltransferase (sialic acid O-acetyltransferase NeuD family)
MNKIAIYAAGGFGREVLTLINHINEQKSQFDFIGFFDDGLPTGTAVSGFKVLGGLQELNSFAEPLQIVVAIGTPSIKRKVVEQITNKNVSYPILIHPNVILGAPQYIKIGNGSIITAGCILTTDIEIAEHVILNLACTVGHDTTIESYASFMPGVNISGEVRIKDAVYVGTGAKIINQLEIGENTIIGAGAVVSKSLPPNCTAVGIPAKPIKFH